MKGKGDDNVDDPQKVQLLTHPARLSRAFADNLAKSVHEAFENNAKGEFITIWSFSVHSS